MVRLSKYPAGAQTCAVRRGVEGLSSDDTNRGSVLLTGSSGKVGRAAEAALAHAGWNVRAFDLAQGDDLRDEAAVRIAASGCRAIVHAGAIPHDSRGSAADIVATNVLGTWHVLLAAEQHRVDRVVSFSSATVFGFYEGEGEPAYLPIDDDHPLRATRPYGMSKRLAEDMCEAWTARTGIPTVTLRPVTVVDDRQLARLDVDRFELGAWIHVDDVADAVVQALHVPVDGHVRVTLCGPGPYDTSHARQVLGWEPTRDAPRRSRFRRLRHR